MSTFHLKRDGRLFKGRVCKPVVVLCGLNFGAHRERVLYDVGVFLVDHHFTDPYLLSRAEKVLFCFENICLKFKISPLEKRMTWCITKICKILAVLLISLAMLDCFTINFILVRNKTVPLKSLQRQELYKCFRMGLSSPKLHWTSLCIHILSNWIIPTLDDGFQSKYNSKANGKQLLSLCCFPPMQSLLMGNILINLTGLSWWDNTKEPLRRWKNYLFQPAITLPCKWCNSASARKSSFIQVKLLTLLAAW